MDITAEVIADFRIWPGGMDIFEDTVKFPDALLQYALCRGDVATGSRRWGEYQPDCHSNKMTGMFLYTAAWLSMYYPDGKGGDVNTEARLNVASKSVGDESIAYRVPQMMEVNNDFLTYTVFGQEFYSLRKKIGMGALAV